MKRSVTMTIEIDATKYEGAEDTDSGTIDLLIDMLRGDADLPEVIKIECGSVVRTPHDER
jgi:hypothetical protein